MADGLEILGRMMRLMIGCFLRAALAACLNLIFCFVPSPSLPCPPVGLSRFKVQTGNAPPYPTPSEPSSDAVSPDILCALAPFDWLGPCIPISGPRCQLAKCHPSRAEPLPPLSLWSLQPSAASVWRTRTMIRTAV
ncbi:hypothetical protein E4U58_001792 [Claviceps cyperi]|nr:hypothetical protein E4U58_001792 [Claviceps cyperi]